MDEFASCPRCGRPGLIVGSRRYYSRGWPATCRECGSLAYDRPHGIVATFRFFLDLLAAPLLVLAMVFIPATFSIVAILSVPFFVFHWWRHRGRPRRAPQFHSISPEDSRVSRRLTYLAILIAFASFGAFIVVAFRPR